jgi:hypothetical protein
LGLDLHLSQGKELLKAQYNALNANFTTETEEKHENPQVG